MLLLGTGLEQGLKYLLLYHLNAKDGTRLGFKTM
jgi:hypothetical protein